MISHLLIYVFSTYPIFGQAEIFCSAIIRLRVRNMLLWYRCYILIFPPSHSSPRKNEYILVFPPERSVYTHLSPWFLRGKSEYILKFPPHTQFSPFALIDYTRAITPIRGRPYEDFCRAFDAEEGRSPLFFSICNTFWNISQWLQFDPYVLFLAMAAMCFRRRIYNSQTKVYTP